MTNQEVTDILINNYKLSYSELANLTGKSSDSVRKKIKKLERAGLIEVIDRSRGENRSTTLVGAPVEKSAEDRLTEAKLKLLEQQVSKIDREELLSEAKFNLLIESLEGAIKPLKFEVKAPFKSHVIEDTDEEVAVLVLSDLHFGKKTSYYNTTIALERFNKTIDNFIKVVMQQKKSIPINKICLLLTGDIVDGENIFPTHNHHIDSPVLSQVFDTAPVFVERIAELASMFEEVSIHCVRGNHGRVSKHNHEDTNFDLFYYKVLEIALRDVENVKFNVCRGWSHIVEVNGVKILQYHGHQIKMTLNLPWYGITTRVSRWASTEKLADFDVAIQGHFHAASILRWNNKLIITNGTIVDGDDFALEFLGLESSQSQWCFGTHPSKKVTWTYQILPE